VFQPLLLSDDHVAPLAEAALTVLERVGILCQNEELVSALGRMGARTDPAAERVWFPREMVTEFVEQLRQEYPRGELPQGPFSPPGPPILSLQVAQAVYDYRRRERRLGTTEDFIELAKLGDVVHGDDTVGHFLLCTDVPPMLEPLEAGMLLCEYAHKPGATYPWHADQVPYLEEMARIMGMENLWVWVAICFGHPLRFDKAVADRFVAMVRRGHDVGLVAMPVAGVTTPVTIEGFIAVSAAEHVATWIAGRCLNPEARIGGSQWAGTIDMRTGSISYSQSDAMYYAFASIEFLRRWTGVSIPPGSGEYCDAKLPGLYAVLEKHYKAMTVAAFTGNHPPLGQGMLECGKTICAAQLMLERDMTGSLSAFGRQIEPTEENLALDTILDIGLGLSRNHLQS